MLAAKSQPTIRVEVAAKILPLIQKPKMMKVAVGGRGGTKSVAFADVFLRYCDAGERLCCAREHQNTIEDSVHALLKDRIDKKGIDERYVVEANKIYSWSGGEIFYRGLSRNITGFKSAHGIKRLWIEEGQGLSEDTIITVLPTIREEGSEIWISANRGASNDAFSRLILKQAEKDLQGQGYYEDDEVLIVEINWWDNPWFPEGLDKLRRKQKLTMTTAMYEHVWNGAYSDTVEDAIIEPEWFDACIDAHEKLGFKPEGIEIVSYDPFDGGQDAGGLAHRHGSVFVHVDESEEGRVNENCDWALDYAQEVKPDAFIWDGDGVGAGLKRQITTALGEKKVDIHMFGGGKAIANPKQKYDPTPDMVMKAKTNQETFYNRRAQRYWNLRDRVYRTYLAIQDGTYTDPGELISFSSKIKKLDQLRAELCQIPRKRGGTGKIQLKTKLEMEAMGIDSPNMADACMQTMDVESIKVKRKKLHQRGLR